MANQVIDEERLGDLRKIGQGGQGVVYEAPKAHTDFAPTMVYKKYKAETLSTLNPDALQAMPQLVDGMAPDNQRRLIAIAAWPCAVVTTGGAIAGFVMPAIPEQFFIQIQTVKGTASAPAEFQHLLNEPSYLEARGIHIDDTQRYSLLRELASDLTFLHGNGICVGDMSPKNLLFSLTPRPAIYFVDCDAMNINGVSALAEVETNGWEVVAGERVATTHSDTYKLGLLALRLLTGDQDEKDPDQLPTSVPKHVRQLISDTLTKPPESRPIPAVWTYLLDEAIKGTQAGPANTSRTPAPTRKTATPKPVLRSRPDQEGNAHKTVAYPVKGQQVPQPVPTSGGGTQQTVGANIMGMSGPTAVALAAIIGSVLLGVVFLLAGSGSNSDGSSSVGYSSRSSTSYSSKAPATAAAPAPVAFGTPPLYQGMDATGAVRCPDGVTLSEYGRRAGIGSDDTSCQFARAVGDAYWRSYPTPSRGGMEVLATSEVIDCRNRPGADCEGSAFRMYCSLESNGSWIECTNRTGALVYLF
jgi:hypothetical protein